MMTNELMLRPPTIATEYLPEPLLVFGSNGKHVDPKEGIARFGPHSYGSPRHPGVIRVGVIGSGATIESAQRWFIRLTGGVPGDARHPEFPGFALDRGFYSELRLAESSVELVSQGELDELDRIRSARERFEHGLDLLDAKVSLLAERDRPPDYIVVALPPRLYQRCRVVDYHGGSGLVHRDLRRAFKARVMRHRIPTQFLRQSVADGLDKDHPSKIAWNFATALYFKAGGVPWAPTELPPATCFIGVSFFRPIEAGDNTVHASLVQAFDEHGEGLVLRGREFAWDPRQRGTKSPHLSADQAAELTLLALDHYQRELKQAPRHVVVHKSSRYWEEERTGFREVLRSRVSSFDLLALEPQSDVRLFTTSKYPPLRGTWFRADDLDYLYTTGFLADLGEYHSMGVPAPIRISDHVGQDTTRAQLLRQLLVLSKMNWNSARLGGLLPVTLRFARMFGDIMKEVPLDREPLPQFKFYI
jgi:hypothetical protein